MSGSFALEVAEIYEALGEHDRAASLRWGWQDPADRLRELEEHLETAAAEEYAHEAERDELRSALRNAHAHLWGIWKILDGVPKLMEAIAAEPVVRDGYVNLTPITAAVDEARRVVRAALK